MTIYKTCLDDITLPYFYVDSFYLFLTPYHTKHERKQKIILVYLTWLLIQYLGLANQHKSVGTTCWQIASSFTSRRFSSNKSHTKGFDDRYN